MCHLTKPEAMGAWNRIVAFLEAASRWKYVVAVRDGMVGIIPIILVGSCCLLLGSLPEVLGKVEWLKDSSFLASYKEMVPAILLPYRLTMGLLSLYLTFTLAAALASQYDLPTGPVGLSAIASFLVTSLPVRLPLAEGAKPEWVLPAKPLGPEGMFLAMIVAVIATELYRVLAPNPKQVSEAMRSVPPAVTQAFRSFLPMLISVLAFWIVRHGLGFDLQHLLSELLQPLNRLGDSLGAVILCNLLLHVFGVAGIHGISLINAIMLPLWQKFVAVNASLHEEGKAMAHVTAYPFYQFFVWLGGAGATLSPTLMLTFWKNPHMRRIGRVSMVPALFNINEPLLFGLPVVANPILAIPFIVAPLVCGLITYFAMTAGFVSYPFIEVPWVMPCFLGGVMATLDYRALGLVLLNLLVAGAIWLPFLRIYQHRLESGAEPTPDELPPDGDREGLTGH